MRVYDEPEYAETWPPIIRTSVPMKTSKVCTTAGFQCLSTNRALIRKVKVFLLSAKSRANPRSWASAAFEEGSSSIAHYLEPEEVRLILEQPERRTIAGFRDHALLLFLYNMGARVSEALAVRLCDLRVTAPRRYTYSWPLSGNDSTWMPRSTHCYRFFPSPCSRKSL